VVGKVAMGKMSPRNSVCLYHFRFTNAPCSCPQNRRNRPIVEHRKKKLIFTPTSAGNLTVWFTVPA
jgi:hypothetical protein